MTTRLVALQAPPDVFGDQLRTLWDAGDAVLPLPWTTPAAAEGTDEHVAEILARHRPHAIVQHTGSGLARRSLDEPVGVVDGTALVVTTSGSTGAPRGVVLSHEALAASTRTSLDRLGVGAGARFMLTLPAHHVAGLQVFLRAWQCGTEPEVVDDPRRIAAPDGWIVSLVSTQLRRIVASSPEVLDHVDTILVGGGPVDEEAVAGARRRGVRVVRSYGMTETCGGCVYDGVPLDGVEVSTTTDARLRIRGPL
ncbi:MAG: AMP-binding protein, partial [Nitriliruptoraceae bacterium]